MLPQFSSYSQLQMGGGQGEGRKTPTVCLLPAPGESWLFNVCSEDRWHPQRELPGSPQWKARCSCCAWCWAFLVLGFVLVLGFFFCTLSELQSACKCPLAASVQFRARNQDTLCLLPWWEVGKSRIWISYPVLFIMNLSLFTSTRDPARENQFVVFPPGFVL